MVHISFRFVLIMLLYWAEATYYKKVHTTLVFVSKDSGLEVNADKQSTSSYVEIRMQDAVTV